MLAALGALTTFFLIGCAPETKQRLLRTFFDGVPVPGATNQPPRSVDDEGRPWTPLVVTTDTNLVVAVPKFTFHAPYEKQQCAECHESKFSVSMKGPQKDVCFSCHKELGSAVKASKRMHQPVENNECTACHRPHGSELPKLLTKPVNALCWDCHDNFVEKAVVKHQPVADGDCLACHSSHQSDIKGLLKKPLAQTCAECHEDADLLKVGAHKSAGDFSNCSKCHDPHVSSEKKLLKPGISAAPK